MFKNHKTLSASFEAGKTWISSFRKVPASTATVTGQWYDYSYASGNPIPNYYAASPLVAATLEPDKGIIVPRMSGTSKQYLHRLSVMSSGATASTQPMYLMDYLLYYPFVDMDAAGEEQAVTNSTSLPRYTDGIGVQMMVVAQSPTVGGGRFTINYTATDDGSATITYVAASVGGGRSKKRKRVIIDNKFYELNDAELKDALEAIISDDAELVIKPEKKARQISTVKVSEASTADIPNVVAEHPDLNRIYEQIAHHNRTREILQQIAWERYIENDDEEILLLVL